MHGHVQSWGDWGTSMNKGDKMATIEGGACYLPLALVDKCIGNHVWIILKGEREMDGILRGFDDFMNLVLESATEYTLGQGGVEAFKVQDTLVNGNSIAMIVPGPRPAAAKDE
ncbi:bifunctional LSM domain [Babesia duncani]|uniref:U6 snRNA-associated Sm-like protein LSm5 n=1 Tax=Babesia duncani TaxID=323732 RepID=A0AAD9PLU1_9APIC|nr:bifunctional LSM domain [Babesia duncani]